MTSGSTTWTYTYNADGLRTQRTNGADTYTYIYNGSKLTVMTKGSDTLYFTYDASGAPLTVNYNNATYYYTVNLQGDILGIADSSGNMVVTYAYDAWGNLLSVSGSMASTLGIINPLRYRGYVYDTETKLYYLQSRYYNPEWGRFINADVYAATGQGFTGNNMFAYCGNNPVTRIDDGGKLWWLISGAVGGFVSGVTKIVSNISTGKTWYEGAWGAAAGGFVYGAVVTASNGNVAAAGYASAAAESFVNEALSYTPIAGLNGSEQKELTEENIITSCANVVVDTVGNGTVLTVTGAVASKIAPTGEVPAKPESIVAYFAGSYAIKSQIQTYAQGAMIYAVDLVAYGLSQIVNMLP